MVGRTGDASPVSPAVVTPLHKSDRLMGNTIGATTEC